MIPSSGKLSFYDIAKEYDLKKPFNITDIKTKISTIPSGVLNLNHFYGKSKSILKESLIYENAASVTYELTNRRPQSLLDVFNSWGRFDGESYYTSKASASGNAEAWVWNSTTSSVEMPLNVSPTNGFVSNLEYDSYDLAATVSSNSADDDTIGLIAAFNRLDSYNHYISFVATNGGMTPTTGIGVYLNYATSSTWRELWSGTIATNKNSAGTGWSNRMIRLRIVRSGDSLSFYHSPMNSDVLSTTPAFVLDLNSSSDFTKFKGKKKYGYMTYSQPNSTYKDISFIGGLDNSQLVDMPNDTVWNFDNTSQAWVNSNTSILNSLGYDKIIINSEGEGGQYKVFKLTKTAITKIGVYQELTNISSRLGNNILVTLKSSNTTAITGTSITGLYKEDGTGINKISASIPIVSKTTNTITINKPSINYTMGNSIITTDTNELFYIDTDQNETTLSVYSIQKFINIY